MTTSTKPAPGTWRTDDETPVPFDEALDAWAAAADEVLRQTATQYNAYITHSELASEVQKRTGIETAAQMRTWIGRVLDRAADQAHERGDLQLIALCVRGQDETVGPGYAHVMSLTGEAVPEDLDRHAAEARLAAYRKFAKDVPSGGGHVALTRKVASARKRASALNAPAPKLCPSCFTQLPASGQCDRCTLG